MASGVWRRWRRSSRSACLNSCSGEVWPRGADHARRIDADRCLNSCSGEVWPRGHCNREDANREVSVSILVLVKYGLGGRGWFMSPDLELLVSILVLVKYGLGAGSSRS